jgi:transposase
MRAALNTLATVAPQWLLQHSQPEWVERYSKRVEDSRLPESKEKRETYAKQVGLDGQWLLEVVYDKDAPEWLRAIPAVDVMRQVWLQQYWVESGKICWRTEKEGIPAASQFISSPYDLEAHYARKHTTSWIGYKVHISETCEEDLPNLITNAPATCVSIGSATSAGPISDGDATLPVLESLQKKDLLPATHIVDTGYLDAKLLLTSQKEFGVDLLGPTRPDYKWQARAKQGFAAEHFQVDWQKQQAICPEGKISTSWSPALDVYGQETIKIKFAQKDCITCPSWSKCTTAARRTITLRKEEYHLALLAARAREETTDYKSEYARRAGMRTTSLSLDPLRYDFTRRTGFWTTQGQIYRASQNALATCAYRYGYQLHAH